MRWLPGTFKPDFLETVLMQITFWLIKKNFAKHWLQDMTATPYPDMAFYIFQPLVGRHVPQADSYA